MAVINRALSLLLGLALVVIGLAILGWIVSVEIGGANLPGSLPSAFSQVVSVVRSADSLALRSPGVRLAALLILLVGLVLLFFELRPSPPRRLLLLEEGPWTWSVDRRSCESLVNSVIGNRTPIRRSRVQLRRAWRLRVKFDGDADVRPEVEAQVNEVLNRLGAPAKDKVNYQVHRVREVY